MNYDKIKWNVLGIYNIKQKVYGKKVNIFRCPICRTNVILYRRKGLLKISCQKCDYENIKKVKDFFKTSEDKILDSFNNLFKD